MCNSSSISSTLAHCKPEHSQNSSHKHSFVVVFFLCRELFLTCCCYTLFFYHFRDCLVVDSSKDDYARFVNVDILLFLLLLLLSSTIFYELYQSQRLHSPEQFFFFGNKNTSYIQLVLSSQSFYILYINVVKSYIWFGKFVNSQ